MFGIVLLFVAAILLAFQFACNKKYQLAEGVSFNAGLYFNVICGFVTGVLFFCLSGFRLNFTLIGVCMALLSCASCVTYGLLGFKVMEKENMSSYTFFLMTGGMILPFVWGLVFLEETFTVLRLAGLVVLTVAIFLTNGGIRSGRRTQILLIAIFILNGITSISNKMHQIDANAMDTTQFICLTGFMQCIASAIALIVKNRGIPKLKCKPTSYLWIVLAVAFSGLSSTFQLNGAKEIMATVLYPIITGGTIIFTALVGMLVFKEKITKRSVIGLLLCLAGTCMFL